MKKKNTEDRKQVRINKFKEELRKAVPDSYVKKTKIKETVLDGILSLVSEYMINHIDSSVEELLTDYALNRNGDALQTVLYFQDYAGLTTDEILDKIQNIKWNSIL